jgi:hypothetical protein
MRPIETQRASRGHRFWPPAAVLRRIPGIRETEPVPTGDKMLHAKYFSGRLTWFVAELAPETGEAFGVLVDETTGSYVWGAFDLWILEAERPRARVTGSAIRLDWLIERDLDWVPRRTSDVLATDAVLATLRHQVTS